MDYLREVSRFLRNEDGLTVVEYVIGAAFLVGTVTLVFTNMGTDLSNKMSSTISSVGS
jgi:pilus assembly protein Flp/PilA